MNKTNLMQISDLMDYNFDSRDIKGISELPNITRKITDVLFSKGRTNEQIEHVKAQIVTSKVFGDKQDKYIGNAKNNGMDDLEEYFESKLSSIVLTDENNMRKAV